jgi:hypothetical protein
MVKTRMASTVASFMVGFAAVGGTVVAIAAPANAASSSHDANATTDAKGQPPQPPTKKTKQICRGC